MLEGAEHIETMMFVRREPVILERTGIDAVTHLLRNHHLMWRKMKLVTATAIFLKMMILSCDLAVKSGLYITTHSEGLSAHFCELRETVSVVVISVLLTVLAENGDSHLVVICHQRSIQGSVVVEC